MATIIKKCDHTPAQRRSCKCNWVVRYRANGRQREKSFAWNTKQAASTFALDVESKKRQGDYVDPKLSAVKFSDAAEKWVARKRATATKATYRSLLEFHINPAIGNMTLNAVASLTGRHAVEELLTVTMPKVVGPSYIKTAYVVIRSVVNDAVKRGIVGQSRLSGIELDAAPSKADFVFPTHDQLTTMVDKLPAEYQLAIWIMRGCGLRFGEVFGLRASDFNGGTLRVQEQMLVNSLSYGPLKHRKPGEYRDVPVPSYVSRMVSEYVSQSDGRLFAQVWHGTFMRAFTAARDAAGIPSGFTPHSLRHVFASVALSRGVPITDVSAWLGHRDINTTYGIYGHLVPSSFDRARNVLDAEFNEWSESE